MLFLEMLYMSKVTLMSHFNTTGDPQTTSLASSIFSRELTRLMRLPYLRLGTVNSADDELHASKG
jgi:hypothetical protein